MTKIEWKAVLGFPGYYATQDGQVRGPSGKVLRQMTMKQGHLFVWYRRKVGLNRKLYVHRAVLLAFIGPPGSGQETRHLDGDPTNNNLSNLKWGTRQENVDDKWRHGVMPLPEACPAAKLTPKQIPEIRALQGHESSRVVGQKFGVSYSTIQNVWNGKTWKGY